MLVSVACVCHVRVVGLAFLPTFGLGFRQAAVLACRTSLVAVAAVDAIALGLAEVVVWVAVPGQALVVPLTLRHVWQVRHALRAAARAERRRCAMLDHVARAVVLAGKETGARVWRRWLLLADLGNGVTEVGTALVVTVA